MKRTASHLTLLALTIIALLFTSVPPAIAASITYVNFRWDPNFSGGSIIADRCIAANYHWLTSEELSPNPRRLGSWGYGAINGCVGHYPAVGVANGDVIEIGIGASDSAPGGDLFTSVGTKFYRVTRVGNSVTWSFTREILPNVPPNPPIPTAPPDTATLYTSNITLQVQDGGDPDNGPRNYRDFYYHVEKTDGTWGQDSGWMTTPWNVMVPSVGTYRWRAIAGDGVVGGNPSPWWTFTRANNPPTISAIADQTISENGTTGPLALTIGDQETTPDSLSLSAISSNPTLLPVANIAFGGSGASRTVAVTPTASQFGSATVTLTVSDGDRTSSISFTLTVTAVNTPPTIDSLADQTIDENGTTGPLAFTIGDRETAADSLTLTATSSDPVLVPEGNIVLEGSGASRTVTVTPAANQSGSATITISISDNLLTTSTSFMLTVIPANALPTIESLADQTIDENGTTGPLAFTIGDRETTADSLTLTATSSDPVLVPEGNIVLEGSGASRTVTIAPAANRSGSATITLSVSDGALSASSSFTLTVTPVNAPPTIDAPPDTTIDANTSTAPLPITIGDRETVAAALTLTATSSNAVLVPTTNISFDGSGASRTVIVTPAAGRSGSATITLIVSDGDLTSSASFLLTVRPINNAPTISTIADQAVEMDHVAGPLSFTVSDAQTPVDQLAVDATSDNPTLLPASGVLLGGAGSGRTITLTPAAGQIGRAIVTITATDGQRTGQMAFQFTVLAAARVYGRITVRADSYTPLPDGSIRATGNIRLGDHLLLEGAGAELRIRPSDNTILGTGTLLHVVGRYPLLSGSFTASGATGLIKPAAGVTYMVSALAGFPTSGTFSIHQIQVGDGVAAGSADIRLSSPGVQGSASADFTIAPGPVFGGTLGAFNLATAGVIVEIGAGTTLTNQGITIPSFTIKLPDLFGGARGSAQGLRIYSTGIQLTKGSITLPELLIGDGTKLRLTANTATLGFNGTTQVYSFALKSTLKLALPGNKHSIAVSLTLSESGGAATISGKLSSLSLTIAGSTLAMKDIAITNDGLSVGAATLSLPPSLGKSITVTDVRVLASGLRIGGGSFVLADIMFGGGGERIAVLKPTVTLQISGDAYALSGTGKLRIRLPQNAPPDSDLSFAFRSDGTFSASLSSLPLVIAGSSLRLANIVFGNDGLHAASATLTLPQRLGSPTATLSNIAISRDGLRLSSATIVLSQDIRFGSTGKLWISGAQLTLVVAPTEYTFTASGTLHVNLPGNAQSAPISFRFSSTGDILGAVSKVTLMIGGTTVYLQNLELSNSGLFVGQANITVRSVTGTLRDIRITEAGLTIGSQSIQLPREIALAGDRVVLLQPALGIQTNSGGYTLTLRGSVKLNLPQNTQTVQNAVISISTSGQFSGSVGQVTLTLGTIQLVLNNIGITNDGLSVASGTLRLPPNLGSASGTASNIRITSSGLSIGGGTVSVPFPDFRLGSGSGFAVTGVRARIEIASTQTYRVTLSGAVQVQIPGSQSSASGSVTVDSAGRLTGSVASFSLKIAGMALAVSNVAIRGDTLVADSASLSVPGAFGGASAAVYNVQIAPGSGLRIGGGSFSLPAIKAGDFTLGLQGSLRQVGSGYEITAGGAFSVPGLGQAAGCGGIAVSVTIATDGAGNMTLQIREPRSDAEIMRAAHAVLSAGRDEGRDGRGLFARSASAAINSISLRQVSLTLNCRIPIGTTGLFLTSTSGTVAIGGGSTRIDIAVRIVAGGEIFGIAPLSADGRAYLQTRPFEMGLSGSVKVFIFEVGGASATLKSNEFRATLYVRAVIARGNINLRAWSDYRGFLFTGSGSMTVGFQKGEIFQNCVWKVCVAIPPFSVDIGGVWVDAGAFRNGAWGFKGNVSYMGYSAGFFIDSRGKVTIGNVDQYRLVSSAQIQAARLAWAATRTNAGPPSDPGLVFPSADVTDVRVPVASGKDLIFALARQGDVPTLTLITPGGITITPTARLANVSYNRTISGTLGMPGGQVQETYVVNGAEAGTWTARLSGSASSDSYQLVVLGNDVPPTFSDVHVAQTGPLAADVAWRFADDTPQTTLSFWASVTPPTGQEHTGIMVAERVIQPGDGSLQHASLDLSKLPSGTYYLYLQADDERNAPVRAYTTTPITIAQPWVATWEGQVRATPDYRSLSLEWRPHPSPDVTGYRLALTTAGTTQVITVGNVLSTTVSALSPGVTYSIALSAYTENGRVAQAPPVTGTPTGAPFTLAVASQAIHLVAGEQATIGLTLTTMLNRYPEGVGLRTSPLSDGLTATFGTTMITPTIASAVTRVTITTSPTMPGGTYYIGVLAQGAGVLQTVDLEIVVAERTFTLTPSQAALTLNSGDQATLQIAATTLNGSNGAIHVRLDGAPVGLDYALSSESITPNGFLTLTLSDTGALFGGSYPLQIRASDGITTRTIPIMLVVAKPGVQIATALDTALLSTGQSVVVALNLSAVNGWTAPISVSVDAAGLPLGLKAGLSTQVSSANGSAISLPGTIGLTPPGAAWLIITADMLAPEGQYDLPLVITGDGREARHTIHVEVTRRPTIWLPIIRRG
jgi:hypothetical protein